MTLQLDTDVCVDLLRNRSPRLVERLRAKDPADLRLSAVTLAELQFGALRSAHPQRSLTAVAEFANAFLVLAFDEECARRCAELRLDLEARGIPIGPNDMLIAATALANDLTLATRNLREFSRVLGLRVEDWSS